MGEELQVAAYVLLGLACAAAAARPCHRRSTAVVLWVGAVLWGGAALAGALSLGGEVSHAGRQAAWMEGWYGDRRAVQLAVVMVLAATTGLAAAVLLVLPLARPTRVLAVTWTALAGFLAIRVVSLHAVDAVLYREGIAGVSRGILFELALTSVAIAWVLVMFVVPGNRPDRTNSVTEL
jgi:hypothetical protein